MISTVAGIIAAMLFSKSVIGLKFPLCSFQVKSPILCLLCMLKYQILPRLYN